MVHMKTACDTFTLLIHQTSLLVRQKKIKPFVKKLLNSSEDLNNFRTSDSAEANEQIQNDGEDNFFKI